MTTIKAKIINQPPHTGKPECKRCYGKGFHSEITSISWSQDFGPQNPGMELILNMNPCECVKPIKPEPDTSKCSPLWGSCTCLEKPETTQEPAQTMQNDVPPPPLWNAVVFQPGSIIEAGVEYVTMKLSDLEAEKAQAEARGIQKCIDALERARIPDSSVHAEFAIAKATTVLKSLLPKDSNHPTE